MRHLLFMAVLSALLGIVPQPEKVEEMKGNFRIAGATFNCEMSLDRESQDLISEFADRLAMISDRTVSFAPSPTLRSNAASGLLKGVCFLLDKDKISGEYSLEVTPKYVLVFASDFYGFTYALQTIRQLLPPAIYGTSPAPGEKWVLPCCKITDKPRFAYRGLLLDCSRHFFKVEEIYRILEIMNVYKLNRFHWHLSDDQGWRVEIKKYPMLTVAGAYRSGTQIGRERGSNDGIGYGGFYTREEIRSVVAYARKLGITIIPEIDLPGHMQAALAAYPELGCSGGPYRVRTGWGVSDQVLCPGKEETFAFIEGVMNEICDLFPSEYIHIGGDECPKTEWEKCPDCQARIAALGLTSHNGVSKEQRLQNYVTERVQKYLASKGRRIIGWDEILEGELAKGATVMSWRGTAGGIKAAAAGFDVIMSPNIYCYFDHSQSTELSKEPLGPTQNPKRAIPLEKIYSFEPLLNMEAGSTSHVLGVQANLWTEYIAEPSHLEYMLLPRLLALSEVQWCNKEVRDYDRFRAEVAGHQSAILNIMGYTFRPVD